MNKLKRIRPYAIFSDIMKCFMMSCGMILLLWFFNYEQLSITKDMIQQSVLVIFILLFVLLGTYEILIGNRWFSDQPIAIESSYGKAARANLIEQSSSIAEYNRKVSAVHEAGHAVMAYLEEIEHFDVMVSYIEPKVVTVQKLQDAEDVKREILIKYAGAIAEDMLFGYFHAGCFTGVESDFSQATEWLKGYIVMTDSDASKSLLNEELSERIIYLSKEFWKEATDILTENRTLVEKLSEELLKKDVLKNEEVKAFLDEIKGN